MTKQDYIRIAGHIKNARPISTDLTNEGVAAAHFALDSVVRDFVEREVRENPRFNPARFEMAAGQVNV